MALASFLLELEDFEKGQQVDSVWEEEIQARIQAIDSGASNGTPNEEVMREAQKRLAP